MSQHPLHAEVIPAREAGSRKLLVMLHGLGDSVDGYRWMPAEMDLPWLNYLLVNAPDEYYGGYSWFDFRGELGLEAELPEVDVGGVERSRRLLWELLDAQRAKGFPTEQMVLGGFSQGCVMSLDVGLRYPHRFACMVGISGFVCEPEKLIKELSPVAREQRLLLTHGTYDPMIPFPMVRAQVALLEKAGLNIEFHEFSKAHTIAGKEELNLLRDFVCAAIPSDTRRTG